MKTIFAAAFGLALASGSLIAGEKSVLHCFAFTPIKEATQEQWDAFYKATDALPGQVPGLKRVWYGKLARPLNLPAADAETGKKLRAEGKATGDLTLVRREHGACMEFADEAAFKAYDAHAAHKAWTEVYGKVRVPGTTTYQIIGQ